MNRYSGFLETYCCRRYGGRVQWEEQDDAASTDWPGKPVDVFAAAAHAGASAPYPLPSGSVQTAGDDVIYGFICPFCEQRHSVKILDISRVSGTPKHGTSPGE